MLTTESLRSHGLFAPREGFTFVKKDILAIDGVTLHDFDFIDLGKVLEPSGTVPVTIKSLVFRF